MEDTSTEHDHPSTDPPQSAGSRSPSGEALSRSRDRRMIAGVAAGMGEYFDLDPTIVRIGFVVLAFLGGLAIPIYAAGWLLIPEEGAEQSVGEELLARERSR